MSSSVHQRENPEDKPHKRSSIRMGMKLFQLAPENENTTPYAAFSKQLRLADGQVELEATLDKAVYDRGEDVGVSVSIANHSSRNVRKIKVMVVQYVDVAMFSNGKFKNIVASVESTDGCPVTPGARVSRQFQLHPARGVIKNWIALEEFYDRESMLASSVARPDGQERNVFAIYVSYYVKVKLFTSAIGGEVSVKVPFKLMRRSGTEDAETNTPQVTEEITDGVQITTSRSMFDLTSRNGRREAARARRSPPSRSTSEDSGRCSDGGRHYLDPERFRSAVQLQGRERNHLEPSELNGDSFRRGHSGSPASRHPAAARLALLGAPDAFVHAQGRPAHGSPTPPRRGFPRREAVTVLELMMLANFT
ncbi:hypothetical protein O3P69_002414 [Scylla paramamosain]|uniref:Arrestin C-terminal-like domain-containing protein n=1 Tax=Scylla paramamosain TaxID=85552 RepID=A0AAW0V723_SCYPA